jgi:four helix bundle protein
MDTVEVVYRLTKSFPREEAYGLTAQMRRAAVSVVSNIAEGHGRCSRPQFRHYLSLANGSLRELETQGLIAGRLGYLSATHVDRLLVRTAELGRLISGLFRALAPRRSSP